MWRLVAHNHWFTIRIFDKEIRLCSRCTGYVLGYSAGKALSFLSILNVFCGLEMAVKSAICLVLVMPFAVDWITQSWGLRNSNNWLRFITGFVLGNGVSLLSFSGIPSNIRFAIVLYVAIIILFCGLSINLKVQYKNKF